MMIEMNVNNTFITSFKTIFPFSANQLMKTKENFNARKIFIKNKNFFSLKTLPNTSIEFEMRKKIFQLNEEI